MAFGPLSDSRLVSDTVQKWPVQEASGGPDPKGGLNNADCTPDGHSLPSSGVEHVQAVQAGSTGSASAPLWPSRNRAPRPQFWGNTQARAVKRCGLEPLLS